MAHRDIDGGYEGLANAIIVKAVEDYKVALTIALGLHPSTQSLNRIIELEKFFRGEWFKVLCDLDGEYLIEKIREGVKKEIGTDQGK